MELRKIDKEEKKGLFGLDERGVGVVELILIIVVLIALVVLFRTQMKSLINTIFSGINKKTNSFLK